MLWSPYPISQRVMVNLHDGSAIKGLLVRQRGPLLILAQAVLLEPGQDRASPMDGQVFIERSQVAFMQATPMEGG